MFHVALHVQVLGTRKRVINIYYPEMCCSLSLSLLLLTLVLIIFCGLFVNGPYALITTAVSSDLVR